MGCHFLLQGIFTTQGSNPGLLHYRQTLYHLSHQGSPSPRIFLFKCTCYVVLCLLTQSCLTLQPMDCSPLSSRCPWGFSMQEYWSGLPCLPLKFICIITIVVSSERWFQFSSVAQSCLTLYDSGPQHARHPCPSPTLRACSEFVMPSNQLILCCPLLLLPSIFTSIRVFSKESVLHISWPKYWSFNFSINPSSEYSGLISFRIDWLDLLTVQGTLKNFLQCHSSKTSVLQH